MTSTVHPQQVSSPEDAIDEFRRLFSVIAEGAAARERDRIHPFDEVRRLVDAGFGRLRVPVEYGGFGVGLPELFELLAELGQADSNLPQVLRGHFTTVEILRHLPESEATKYWFEAIAGGAVFGNAQSEPASEAGFALSTRITDESGTKTVSGRKYYSTGSLYADYIRVATLDPEENRTFAVVRARDEGVSHLDDWDGIGQRLTGSGTTVFDRVPVADHGLYDFGESAGGFHAAFVQIVHLANLTGIARNILADTVELVRSRVRTSLHALSEKATEDPAVLGVVGQISAQVRIAEALLTASVGALSEADRRFESGERSENLFTEAYIVTSEAQIGTIDAVTSAANLLFHAGGSSTVREVHNFDRHWRNARTLSSHNPVIYKPHVIGDYVVNGAQPKSFYQREK